jgi:pimeloyl-ACP methyl ester carboxylesterase
VGTGGKEVLVEQQYLIPKQSGESEEYCRWNQEVFEGMSTIVAKYSPEKATAPLNEFLDKQYLKAPENYKELANALTFKFGMQVFLNNTWGHEFVNFYSEDYLKKIKVPILAVNGSRDIQVPPVSNQKGFNEHFSKKSKPKSKAIIVQGLNHLMQTCKKCDITEYGELEESFSPEVLKIMSDWIKSL